MAMKIPMFEEHRFYFLIFTPLGVSRAIFYHIQSLVPESGAVTFAGVNSSLRIDFFEQIFWRSQCENN